MPSNIISNPSGGSVQNIPANIVNGIMDSRNPNLLPNVDPILAMASGTVDQVSRLQHESIPDFIVDAGETAAQATGSVALGGTETDGDMLSITLAGVTVTHTTSGGESLSAIATALAGLINTNSSLNTNFHAVGSTSNVNISALSTGAYANSAGNGASLSTHTSVGATETMTVTPFSGGAGLMWPQVDFQFTYNGQMLYFLKGRPIASNDSTLLAQLAAMGVISSST